MTRSPLALLTGLALACLASATNSLQAEDDILTTAAGNGSFNTLVGLVVAADLDDALQGDGSFTVFAPTDAAFERLPAETLQALREPGNREQLASILKYHVVPAELTVPNQAPSHPIESAVTLQGESLKFARKGHDVFVNDAQIVTRDIRCSNGIIQVIDAVLMPPDSANTLVQVADNAGSFKQLLAAVAAAGLQETLMGEGPFTVLAPTDDAFAALPEGFLDRLLEPENRDQLIAILKYHVISGRITARDAVRAEQAETLLGLPVSVEITAGVLKVNDVRVSANDIEADNGIIHVIEAVLLPPGDKLDDESTSSAKPTSVGNSRQDKVVTIRADWDDNIVRDGIEADTIDIIVSGGGTARLTNIRARMITTRVGGGSSISLAGTADQHMARVSGGAVMRAADLETGSSEVTVSGGGVASLNATELLDVSANGGAEVRYVPTNAKIKKRINKYASFIPIGH